MYVINKNLNLDSELKIHYLSYLKKANCIKNWDKLTRTELADNYLIMKQNNNLEKADSYFCALVCSYFYMVPYLYKNTKCLILEPVDCLFWLIEAINTAFKYKAWQNPHSKCFNNADKAFNICISTVRKLNIALKSRPIRRYEYVEQKLPYDDAISTNKYTHDTDESSIADNLIQSYVDNQNFLPAVILDIIAFGDNSFKKSGDEYLLNIKKVVTQLTDLNQDYLYYFAYKYSLNDASMVSLTDMNSKIKKQSRYKLKKCVENILAYLKENVKRDDILC